MGTYTITTTAAEDTRLAVAFGKELGLQGNATAAQVKGKIAEYLINVVQRQETTVSTPAPIAPT